MRSSYSILALAALLLIPAGTIVAADEPSPASDSQAAATDAAEPANAAAEAPAPEPMDVAETVDEFVGQYPDEQYLTICDAPYQPWLATRFGWWGLSTSGSPYGVGEWQGLNTSTPFWDVDGITSDGTRTIDFFATGPEDEANQAGLYFYGGPRLSVDVDYDRFIHRLGHDPIGGEPITPFDPVNPFTTGFAPPGGFYDPPLASPTPGFVMWGEDFNPDTDYAIRVQTLDAKFQGDITENLKWRLNVWGMKKDGIRQANSIQHCYNKAPGATAGTCHLVSQAQHINWVTTEIEPVIEARFGWLTVEYSRTMRSFRQSDQIVTNDFDRGTSSLGLGANADFGAYAYVPENYTEIDRVKLRGDLGLDTEMYVMGHVGNTHNEFRESDRKFYGVDARVTNTAIDGLALTAYGKTFTQNNSADTVSLNDRYPAQSSLWLEQVAATQTAVAPQAFYGDEPWYLGLADREWIKLGVKGRWRPFRETCDWRRGFALTGGYEWSEISRTNVTYELENLTTPGPIAFTQPTTVTNMLFVGVSQDWSRTLSSYLRYRFIDNSWPLLGVTHREQLSLDAAVNSNQPEREDRIEIGGNWSPTDNFLLNASFWIQNTYNHSDLVDFDEDSYPIVVSAWYAPEERWAFTGGYATFSNWIDQDVTLGREDGLTANEVVAWTSTWNYAGRADVFNLGASYAWTSRTTLIGGVEYVPSRNVFAEPAAPAAAVGGYADLPGYSAVRVNTYRLTAGVDYDVSQNMNTFFRYNYFDYDDRAMAYNAGTAHMFLAGLSGVF